VNAQILAGKKAFITGGSMGIGTAVTYHLAEAGADVAFTYRRHEEEANALAKKVEGLGRKAVVIQADSAVFAEAEGAVKSAVDSLGGLDILVNNAGINRDGVVWKMAEDQWDIVLDVNLKGYFNYIRFVAPILKGQGGGKIVNITSINGLRGKFGQSNYSAAKAGIIGLTKAVARELGRFSVNVNAVAPGLIETEMVAQAPAEVKDKALAEIVLGRLGAPSDVAMTVAFLCSDWARHITGEVIRVDGGQYI
jgi:3-oxoacyl-[acyl-carrier protein] reductase